VMARDVANSVYGAAIPAAGERCRRRAGASPGLDSA
jgi:hypothetical protein